MPAPSTPPEPIGVVVVTFNSRAYFARLNAALQAQTQPFRLIVVDNASALEQRPQPEDFPGAEIIQMAENTGFATANNRAVDRVEGAYVALLNPDAFPAPDWLARLAAAAAQRPDVASFGSTQLADEDDASLDGLGDCYHAIGIPWRGGYGWPVETPRTAGEPFSVCAAAALYRRDAWRAVGGFDESYFCYCEDVDLGFRLRLAGWRALQVPEAVVRHVGGASSGKQSDFAVRYGTRNRLWTFVKDMPAPAFWPLLPLHVAATAYLLARAWRRNTGPATWQGLREGVGGLGQVWRARQSVQRARKARTPDLLAAMTWSPAALRTRAPVLRRGPR